MRFNVPLPGNMKYLVRQFPIYLFEAVIIVKKYQKKITKKDAKVLVSSLPLPILLHTHLCVIPPGWWVPDSLLHPGWPRRSGWHAQGR